MEAYHPAPLRGSHSKNFFLQVTRVIFNENLQQLEKLRRHVLSKVTWSWPLRRPPCPTDTECGWQEPYFLGILFVCLFVHLFVCLFVFTEVNLFPGPWEKCVKDHKAAAPNIQLSWPLAALCGLCQPLLLSIGAQGLGYDSYKVLFMDNHDWVGSNPEKWSIEKNPALPAC